MKVLIACEFSAIVRTAFAAKGHNAWSCDLNYPSEIPGNHIQDDVLRYFDADWDMMIAHPPCTYLASSGLHWNNKIPGRDFLTKEAIKFALRLVYAQIPKICIENPIGILSTKYRKPDQIIQPWMFGHPESKATCLWLKGLPKLVPTDIVNFKKYRCKCGNIFETELGKYGCCDSPAKPLWDNQTKSGQNKMPPSDHRAKDRSRTYSGIAKAMSEQWSDL